MSSDILVGISVAGFLRQAKPAGYCDPCLAEALHLPIELVLPAAEVLAQSGNADRKIGRCTPCRSTKRLVTRIL